jgi:hypothetical protein
LPTVPLEQQHLVRNFDLVSHQLERVGGPQHVVDDMLLGVHGGFGMPIET